MKTRRVVPLFLAAIVLLSAVRALATVKLPAVFGENMVLQRERPLPIWGWDDPDTEVTVTLGESKATAKSGADGKWMAKLPAMKAGGPHTLKISGTDTIILENILIGEVWLCSGQSNMSMPVEEIKNAEEEIAASNHPHIRHLRISLTSAAEPQSDVAFFARGLEDEIEAVIPPRRNAKIKQHGNASQTPISRDEAICGIRRVDRKAWKKEVGYHRRSSAETAMYRMKCCFGDKLKNRELENQRAESRLRSKILNRFTHLGLPQFEWS